MKGHVLFLFLIVCGCLGQGEQFKEQARDVFEDKLGEDTTVLQFDTYNGEIEVHTWDMDSYKIEVNKWASDSSREKAQDKIEKIDVQCRKEGNTLLLHVDYETMPKKIFNSGADIVAYLPRKAFSIVTLQTLNGEITTEHLEASHIVVKTFNGRIEADLNAKVVEVETLNGEIRGTYAGDDVSISTINGKIDIACAEGGRYTVTTSNGEISATVAGDFGFEAKTLNGTVLVNADHVTYAVEENNNKEGYTSQSYGTFIKASTSNGSIEITKV